ncbi:MAG: nucleotidyl transferase AbiEii/AbiGii toxin family protein [Actinomycetia bacterium]|nr:nucleotidyl transferase AbiEii/AbiGii toxin family protein [Actinomycetes bacterium]
MSISRATAGGRAYLDLQRRAKDTNRNTQELIQLYILEGFLARLAASPASENFVLKGGVLLAAFGNRRPTRDIDFAGRDIGNDEATILGLIKSVLAVQLSEDDGIEFAPDTATAEVIRDEDEYPGVRVSSNAKIATSRNRFHIDVNVGDPIVPSPTSVSVPRLIGGDPITLKGYPLHMVHAEKIVTAVQRGVANTRWRDFGDIWTLSRTLAVAGLDLQGAIREVAHHRRAELSALSDVLNGYAELAQARWAAWRRRNNRQELPAQFSDLLSEVINFAEPAITDDLTDMRWSHDDRRWL